MNKWKQGSGVVYKLSVSKRVPCLQVMHIDIQKVKIGRLLGALI